ncbi:hypothetical protein [Phycicoccus flavus]|uniref:hypothetical protein n=1 Tax=Phycicoccus flavus TaxID=2502783 RepID=UPI000FEC11D7|nr:hypothetical protein [Phycicoccus flavus]NHA68287.1 hypothetical protein [Phycicoccus flavus]
MSPPPVVAVVAASGGLGASTLAVAVARRLAAAAGPSVVVDLDLPSGGLDVTAGVEHLAGRRWPAFAELRGEVPPGPLVASLPHEDGCHVLSSGGPGAPPPPAPAVADVLHALTQGVPGVVLDLPRWSPHLPAALAVADLVVVLCGLRTRLLADADACVTTLLEASPPGSGDSRLRLVTRAGGPAPPAAVLDDVEAHLGVERLAHLPDDATVVRDAERGLWPGTGRDAVRRCAEAVVGAAADGGAAAEAGVDGRRAS